MDNIFLILVSLLFISMTTYQMLNALLMRIFKRPIDICFECYSFWFSFVILFLNYYETIPGFAIILTGFASIIALTNEKIQNFFNDVRESFDRELERNEKNLHN